MVNRGVIGAERAGQQRLKAMAAADVATNMHLVIITATDPYQLRERRDVMRRLVRGDGDIRGRRLYTDAALMDARYVLKCINTRLRGAELTERQALMLLNSITRVYKALEAGQPFPSDAYSRMGGG